MYDDLDGRGLAVLYDDRDVSPGVKFADADLLGMPVQLVVGAKGSGAAWSSARTAPPARVTSSRWPRPSVGSIPGAEPGV